MSLNIRSVIAGDNKEVNRIVKDVFDEYGMTLDLDDTDKSLLTPHLYDPTCEIFFIAEKNGQVVGCVSADVTKSRSELHKLYIDKKMRGEGIGRKLCEAVEAWSREKGASEIVLWSDVRFVHAHALYYDRGYRIFSTRILNDPDRIVEFGMNLNLTPGYQHGFDPLVSNLRATVKSLEFYKACENSNLAHKLRYVAIGIFDPRKFQGQGKDVKKSQVDFDVRYVFGENVSNINIEDIKVLVAGEETPIGFLHKTYGEILHPSFKIVKLES